VRNSSSIRQQFRLDDQVEASAEIL